MLQVICTSGNNDAVLNFNRLNDTEAHLIHTNSDDSFYWYQFLVTGTKEELDLVQQFCNLVTGPDVDSDEVEGE